MSDTQDPFQTARRERGVMQCEIEGEPITMILRHADVMRAAKDWRTYSSDAPFRVPIPSEEALRSMRQLPIETDPPEHTEWRAIVEPFFQRAKDPAVAARIERLIDSLVRDALQQPEIEVVEGFALPLQSRALTHLLNVPEDEAGLWITWGIHVFHVGGNGPEKGRNLEEYLQSQFDRAESAPGDDFFSALTRASHQGRPLTREEMMGFANLTFAGGRDTIIHTVSTLIAHFARHPDDLRRLRENPKHIALAAEEFFRVATPLTHIGRVCPVSTEVHGVTVPADHRVSLCWASANMDETVFTEPAETRIDRKPNPHIAFGAGAHFCLGAPHARLLVKLLISKLAALVSGIEILEARRKVEAQQTYQRENGYDLLRVRFHPATTA
jgi:cytochrome P450